jgi:hypothetical protein
MIGHNSLLVALVQLVDHMPVPPPPAKRGPGHPRVYTERLFLKALVIMIVRHLHTPSVSCWPCWPNRRPRCSCFAFY